MEEKVKTLALLGAGALLGSAAAVAILKLLPRSLRKECIREAAQLNGFQQDNHPRIDNHHVASIDLLNDDVVSEQLTRVSLIKQGCMIEDEKGNEYQKGGCGGFGKGNISEFIKSVEQYEKMLEAKQPVNSE